jgi:hypothetical protein
MSVKNYERQRELITSFCLNEIPQGRLCVKCMDLNETQLKNIVSLPQIENETNYDWMQRHITIPRNERGHI